MAHWDDLTQINCSRYPKNCQVDIPIDFAMFTSSDDSGFHPVIWQVFGQMIGSICVCSNLLKSWNIDITFVLSFPLSLRSESLFCESDLYYGQLDQLLPFLFHATWTVLSYYSIHGGNKIGQLLDFAWSACSYNLKLVRRLAFRIKRNFAFRLFIDN